MAASARRMRVRFLAWRHLLLLVEPLLHERSQLLLVGVHELGTLLHKGRLDLLELVVKRLTQLRELARHALEQQLNVVVLLLE
jgi:hypothetical protein